MKGDFVLVLEDLLRQKGYRFASRTMSDSFGDTQTIYTKGQVEVRFGSDRGQAYVDMRNAGVGEWVDLALLLAHAGHSRGDVLNEDLLVASVKQDLMLLEGTIAALPREQIEQLRDARTRRRIPGLLP